MPNMSYCRFQNTLDDLKDCAEALDNPRDDQELSPEELKAKKELIELCTQISNDHGE